MQNFRFEDLDKKDFLLAFGLWIVMEVVSFVIFPGIRLINPAGRLGAWFALSLPLGLGGAFLVGASSRFVAAANERAPGRTKTWLNWLGQFGGWIGLAGVMFPLVTVMIEFLTKAFAK
jgi:cytochrome c oxidase assembly factor CtaG